MTVAIAASVCVSVMTPVCAYFIRSRGFVLVIAVAIFFLADTYQNAQGWQTFKSLTISAELTAAEARVTAAQEAVDDLPTPSATGEIRRASTWETVNSALTARLTTAKNELKDLQTPETPLLYVGIVMGLIQIALSIFFACMGRAPKPTAPTESGNVIVLKQRAKPMDAKDQRAWAAISKVK
ncbi:MAG: hypothetical protein AAGC56_08050 [Pseudomonadota bacterium]